jgi:UrcA family protein
MIASGLIAVALGASSLSNFNRTESGKTSITVSVRDLNLDSDDGQRRLRTRLSTAVSRVCGQNVRGIAEQSLVSRCKREARSSAQEQIAGLQGSRAGRDVVLADLP